MKKAVNSKIDAVNKLKSTHGNTGRFLINESLRQTDDLFSELLHRFVYKQEGFHLDAEELMD